MRVFVVEPPARFITYSDAVARLKLDGSDDEQADVESMIDAATAHIDGPDGWLGRALGPQTLEARLDSFADCRYGSIFLPFRPVIDVVSINYVDASGTEQTVDAGAYELLGREVVSGFGATWPASRYQREAVRVRYRAGYASDPEASPLVAKVPEPIRNAILLMVGDLYANRETTTAGTATGVVEVPMSANVTNLLSPFRVWD